MSEADAGAWTDETDRAPADDVSRETAPEDPDGSEAPEALEAPEDPDEAPEDSEDPDGSDERSRLNGEAAKYRKQRNEQRARADDYGSRLFHALVAADGRLTDATDMPVDMDLLDDPDALDAAIESLIDAKPHLKRKTFSRIGAHERGGPQPVSLAEIMRRNA